MQLSELRKTLGRHHMRFVWGMLAVFGIIFSLISFINHYTFRTEAFDLGIFNNAIYDYSHFRWNDNSIKLYDNILSDHFTLLHIPFSLFTWIFGTYTLLVFQILSILFGAYGAFKFHLLRSKRPVLSLVLLLHFLTMWGIYSALSYEYHDNIVGAMMVPWFFYYFHQKKWLPASFYFFILLISKENMALWAVFLGLGMAVYYYKDKVLVKHALLFSVVAGIYFFTVVKVIIPALAVGERPYDYIGKYAILGNGFSEVILNCLTKPQYIFSLLFENHLHDPVADGIKSELHWMVLLSGGVAVFLQPVYLIMLIPIYAQKLFSQHYAAWGINMQYSIEYVPIINMALLGLVQKYPRRKGWIILLSITALSMFVTFRSFSFRVSKWYDKDTLRFYSKHHYRRGFNVRNAHRALEKYIPDDAPVSAHPFMVPHLAFRDYIYEFPYIGNANYLAFLLKCTQWESDPYGEAIAQLKASGEWKILYNEDCVLIMQRKNMLPLPKEKISFERLKNVKRK